MTTASIPNSKASSISENLFLQLLDRYLVDAKIRFLGQGLDSIVGNHNNEVPDKPYDVAINVHHSRFFLRVLAYGNLGLGEAFIARDFDVVEGTLQDFLSILLRNKLDKKVKKDIPLALKIFGIQLGNLLRGEQQNVQRHYDIGDDLFEAFLDPTLTYSCGYALSPEDSLEQLQLNKLERICQKLKLKPGDHLLDIGCGFGGLLLYAAKNYGVTGIGITTSKRHCERGNENIFKTGLTDQIQIQFRDHRSIDGSFDKVVSVGMMEHLPRKEYGCYIRNIAQVLTPQGMGLIHAIGCNTSKNKHDPFIQKYIFPGSGQPKLSEISMQLERNHLATLDVENIVRHYGYTTRRWLQNFQANKNTLDANHYDDQFMRMWEYYLCCGIAAAFVSESAVYQVLFTKDHTAHIPLQRV
ncbi:MAG: methyltransferase domain-containing protein [Symploca sp. SIO2C1]|nr:methyltransferase domain-containing protein [Symploca sp. SIO2C1]